MIATLYILVHNVLSLLLYMTTYWRSSGHFLCFVEEAAETSEGKVTCPSSHSYKMAEVGLKAQFSVRDPTSCLERYCPHGLGTWNDFTIRKWKKMSFLPESFPVAPLPPVPCRS